VRVLFSRPAVWMDPPSELHEWWPQERPTSALQSTHKGTETTSRVTRSTMCLFPLRFYADLGGGERKNLLELAWPPFGLWSAHKQGCLVLPKSAKECCCVVELSSALFTYVRNVAIVIFWTLYHRHFSLYKLEHCTKLSHLTLFSLAHSHTHCAAPSSLCGQ